jgi:hypothetical protein
MTFKLASTGKAALEPSEPVKAPKGFSVAGHPYSFKFKGAEIKPNKLGIYTPKNEAELAALKHYASRGLISYEE